MPDANPNTTHIEPHQTMHMQSGPSLDEQAARAAAVAAAAPNPESTPEGNEPESRAYNPRQDAMDAIFAKRNQMIEKELGIQAEISAASPPNPNDEPAPQDPAAASPQAQAAPVAQAPAAQAPAQAPAPNQLPDRIPVLIGGQELQISREELVSLAQRGLQATQIHSEAAQMREHAQRMIGAGQQAPQAPQQQVRAQPAPQTHAPVVDEATAREISRRLNYGTEQEQAQAIAELGNVINRAAAQQAPQQPQINPQELVQNVTRQVIGTIQHQNNLQNIASEYRDVFEQAPLSYAAGYMANVIAQRDAAMGRPRPQIETFREALNAIRAQYIAPRTSVDPALGAGHAPANNPPAPQAATTPVAQQMSDRIERKRAAPQPPVAANVRSRGEPERKFPSNSEIVSQMRKARGQSAF